LNEGLTGLEQHESE